LDFDTRCEPTSDTEIRPIEVEAGDVVLMDIRLPHCGSTDEELDDPAFLSEPKILVSIVLGSEGRPLTRAMEAGNRERLRDWDARHGGAARRPRLAVDA
jgi:hypothetical protein